MVKFPMSEYWGRIFLQMNQVPYPFIRHGNKYAFVSVGKSRIKKIVKFTPWHNPDIFDLSFGDIMPDGRINDTVISNNGDTIKVLTTVIATVMDFLNGNSHALVSFTGSTPGRTAMYERILRMYYKYFSDRFSITSLCLVNDELFLVEFNSRGLNEADAFLIERKL
jgi:hypothetical protein